MSPRVTQSFLYIITFIIYLGSYTETDRLNLSARSRFSTPQVCKLLTLKTLAYKSYLFAEVTFAFTYYVYIAV